MCGKPKAEVYRMLAEEANKEYVSVIDGVKMIDTRLLDVLQGNIPEAEDKDAESQPKTADQPDIPHDEAETADDEAEEDEEKEYHDYLIRHNEELSEMVRHLLAQLRKADDTIAERDKQIHKLSLELAEMATKTHEITDKALNTVAQQQYLTALAQKNKLPWYKRLLPIGRGKEDENRM